MEKKRPYSMAKIALGEGPYKALSLSLSLALSLSSLPVCMYTALLTGGPPLAKPSQKHAMPAMQHS